LDFEKLELEMKIILDNGKEIAPSNAQKNAIEYVLSYFKDSPKKMTLDELYEKVGSYLSILEFDGGLRRRELVYARQLFSIIANKSLGYSLKEIGDRLGGRDHSSIIHGIDRLRKLLAVEEQVRKDLDDVCSLVGVINPMVYQLPKKESALTIVPVLSHRKVEFKEPPKKVVIRAKADHTNRNYLEEYGV
jgi:hypothetical protein